MYATKEDESITSPSKVIFGRALDLALPAHASSPRPLRRRLARLHASAWPRHWRAARSSRWSPARVELRSAIVRQADVRRTAASFLLAAASSASAAASLAALGRHVEVDVVVDANVDDPVAQAAAADDLPFMYWKLNSGFSGPPPKPWVTTRPSGASRCRVFNAYTLASSRSCPCRILAASKKLGQVAHHLSRGPADVDLLEVGPWGRACTSPRPSR